MSPEERFWAKVDVGLCWEWTASLFKSGYGHFRLGGRGSRTVRAHRFAWELLVGPIPDDLVLDHLCKNKRCVNPDHLEVVTRAENTRRARGAIAAAGRLRPAKTHCVRGHERVRRGVGCSTCKREYDSRRDYGAERRLRRQA